jgi:hypothetical protein
MNPVDIGIVGLPLVILLVTGFVPDRHVPSSPLLASQRWGWRDLIIMWTVLIGIQLGPVLGASAVTGMRLWALNYATICSVMLVTVWLLVRRHQSHPWRALGFDTTTALCDAMGSVRLGAGIVSIVSVVRILENRQFWDAPVGKAMIGPGEAPDFLIAVFCKGGGGAGSGRSLFPRGGLRPALPEAREGRRRARDGRTVGHRALRRVLCSRSGQGGVCLRDRGGLRRAIPT